MLVLCCGSRNWCEWFIIKKTLFNLGVLIGPFTVLHGGACGVDTWSGWAARGLGLNVEVIEADWRKHGKRAGFIRNSEMLARRPDYVIAFWDGLSRGTLDTISKAVNEYRIPTIIVRG